MSYYYFDWVDEGKIKRVRGTEFSSKIAAGVTTRIIDASRGIFNNFIPDVWIGVTIIKTKIKRKCI